MFDLEDDKMSDEELLQYVSNFKTSPQLIDQYEKRYEEYFDKRQRGEKINVEDAELVQDILVKRGSRFALYNRIFK